jgi:hypothetical protein
VRLYACIHVCVYVFVCVFVCVCVCVCVTGVGELGVRLMYASADVGVYARPRGRACSCVIGLTQILYYT